MNSFAIVLRFCFYTPIIASGNNANVLHYIENNQQCKAGDLILLDVAAEYANYLVICRVPFRFQVATLRDKRSVQCRWMSKRSYKNADYRNTLKQYHIEVGKLMTSELLGLVYWQSRCAKWKPDWPAYKKIFHARDIAPHGIDTHDYGILTEPMQVNMVFTVEPGIYISLPKVSNSSRR
jgi:Xaa-Pro aminopeptidase